MQVLIENYRGWEIFFDTDKENFYTTAEEYDYETTKKSFASAKKFIDDFLKNNIKFTPIWVQRVDSSEPIKLIGIRKDGRFVYESRDEKPRQLESYYEDNYFLVDDENDKHFAKIKELESEISANRQIISEIKDRIKKVGLDTLKEKYKSLID